MSSSATLTSVICEQQISLSLGLHPWERHPERPTPLVVSVSVGQESGRAALLAGQYIDYDCIRAHINTWQTRPHTELLETLAVDLIDFCFANTTAGSIKVSLFKPDIFIECRHVGIEVTAERDTWGQPEA